MWVWAACCKSFRIKIMLWWYVSHYILYTMSMSYPSSYMYMLQAFNLYSSIDDWRSLFCCVFSWNQKGCCAGFSQERWVCLSSSPSYWFLFSVFTWTESMAFFYWSSTLSFSSLPCSLNLELSNSDNSRNTNWTSAKIFRRSKKYIRNVLEYIYFCKCMFLKIMSNYCALDIVFKHILNYEIEILFY